MAIQKIVNGPSRWGIMLGFFEKKEVTFTLEDGTIVIMNSVDAMWNMSLYDSIDPDSEIVFDEGYLLSGADETGDCEIFVEYCARSRQGICLLVPSREVPGSAFMPWVWSDIMGLDNLYTSRPS